MRKFVLAVVLVLMASGAQAATLNIVGGQLMGASGVLVDGNPYDVAFVDGTCIDLFSGCNESSDFTFNSSTEAQAATTALIDQVFDNILSPTWSPSAVLPEFVNGINATLEGYIFTLYAAPEFIDENNQIGSVISINTSPPPPSAYSDPLREYLFSYFDASFGVPPSSPNYEVHVFARWTLVPEPSTGLLVGLGLAGIAGKGRRRNRS